ncbi:N-alpha-acetyltransferase 15, NatA auxiliary subunit-like [Symsagittifera roscoffensis]|uniref:N-alpha-acetyltransferase 15, NatA auxiliary subunit-like n=1 Tax=Symsagittifera roscoffensis TaxID=84072 RepID=UPI00307C1A5F
MSGNNSQTLPAKENTLFKKLMKSCEQKQYKNGLKLVKQILGNPNCAQHGETIAMKGLIFSCIGKKTEARELVKQGLLFNLKSHVCWHVSGLIERSDRNYEKAIKCYINALKWDKENLQILRDLSMLQVHIRDLNAFKETRYTLLGLRPSHRVNWIAYAIAHHLLKEYDVAIKLLDQLRVMDTERNFEYSELLLYQNTIYQEAGYVDAALKHLNENSEHIVDKLALTEYKLSLHRLKEDKANSVSLSRNLLMRNPDNPVYYKSLIELMRVSDDEETLAEFFSQMKTLYPRYDTPKRLELQYFKNERFVSALDTYLRKAFVKGLPALFRSVKPLYEDPEKASIIGSVVLGYYKTLQSSSKFHESDTTLETSPTTVLWVLHFLAQHYDYIGDQQKEALECINEAIEHTPTLLELLLVKAKILKHCGDIENACEALVECQSLDTADRYLNCKCAKYLLRASRVQDAIDMCSKFTREGQEVVDNLNEMQCLWFLSETGAAYQRKGTLGEALKKCHQVLRHFEEIWEGQFDFHAYSMRKMTLRAYVQLLKLEDRIYEQRFFFKVADMAIKMYLHIFDNPHKEEVIDESKLSLTELKKLRKKQEKEAKKAEDQRKKEEEERQKQLQKQRKEDGDAEGPTFAELIPSKLERPEDPLHEAEAFLKPLLTYGDKCINTHLLAFEVYFRKEKVLLMLRSLKRAYVLDPKNAQLYVCIVKFALFVQKSRNTDEILQQVITSQSEAFLPTTNELQASNERFIEEHSESLPHYSSGLRVKLLLEKESPEDLIETLINAIPAKKSSLKDSLELFDLICGSPAIFGAVSDALKVRVSEAFAAKHPLSTCFNHPNNESLLTSAVNGAVNSSEHLANGKMEPDEIEQLKSSNIIANTNHTILTNGTTAN